MPRFKRYTEKDKISVENFNLLTDYVEALANMTVAGANFVINRGGASLDATSGPETVSHWCKLTTPCPAAQGNADGQHSNAAGVILGSKLGEPAAGLTLQEDSTITITNRDKNFSAQVGDTILVVRVKLDTAIEWQPLNPKTIEVQEENPPPGTAGGGICACDDCHTGTTIPDASVCCRSFLKWEFYSPWFRSLEDVEANGGFVTLSYAGADTWKSAEFDGPEYDTGSGNKSQNTYQWVLAVSNTLGASELKLEIVVDGGVSKACLSYKTRGYWKCQCPNVMEITANWGNTLADDFQRTPNCRVCVNPKLVTIDFHVDDDPAPFDFCGQSVDPPILWFASWQDMTGAVCGGGCDPHTFLNYQGTYDTGTPAGATDITFNINILKGYPLVTSGGGPNWASVKVSGEDPTIGVLYCPGCSGSQPLTGITPKHGRVALTASCDQTDQVLKLWAAVEGIGDIPSDNSTGTGCTGKVFGGNPVNIYEVEIPYTDPEEVPCLLNQPQTLTNTFFGTSGFTGAPHDACIADDTCDECDIQFDPAFTDSVFIPGEIRLIPFGGGPSDCPNPDLTDVPTDPPPNGSGSCASCDPDSGSGNTDDGACCVEGQCLQFVSSTICTAFSGTMYGNLDLCEDVCGHSACCYIPPAGFPTCADGLTAEDCHDLRGMFINGFDCSTISCGQAVTGACCLANGDCVDDMNAAVCVSSGVSFYSSTDCATVTCAPTGACCDPIGTCSLLSEVDCAATGAYTTWYGAGTNCAGRVCLGACCCDDTLCCVGVMTRDPCLTGSGTPGHPTSDCSGVLSWVSGDNCSHCSGSC